MAPSQPCRIVPLHRGFSPVGTFAELPQPTRPFAPPRSAAHIDLPLQGPRSEPVYGMPDVQRTPPMPRTRPIRVVEKATVDAMHERRANAQRHSDALKAAETSGHERGLVEGYWRGARFVGALCFMVGLAAGVLLVRLGALS